MVAASYGTDLATIDLCEATTNFSAFGGGASGLSASPDIAMEGTNCVDKQVTNADKGMMSNITGITLGADDHIYVWISATTPGLLDTYTLNGHYAAIGTGTGAFVKFHLTGSDEFTYDQAFKCWPIRYVNTSNTSRPERTLVGSPGTAPTYFGAGISTTQSVKGANLGVDGMRYGTGYYITGGTGADTEADFAGAEGVDSTSAYGIFQVSPGGYVLQGRFVIGQNTSGTATACEFLDSNTLVAFENTEHSLTDFTQIIVDHASTILTLTDVTFLALGTNNPGQFNVQSNDPTVNLTRCVFDGMGTSQWYGNSTLDDCVFRGAGQITCAGAADLRGTSVAGYEGTANTSALIWNLNTDPANKLDNMTFTKGTAATHAIEFGANIPATINLNGITFSGYNASNNQNDSALHFKDTSGTITVNYSGAAPSYRTDGATISLVQTNTLTVNVDQDINTEIRVMDAGTQTVIAGIETIGATKTWSTGIDATTYPSVDIRAISLDYEIQSRLAVSMSSDRTIDFQQSTDRQYENP